MGFLTKKQKLVLRLNSYILDIMDIFIEIIYNNESNIDYALKSSHRLARSFLYVFVISMILLQTIKEINETFLEASN